ncbi:Succinate dehydrogenase cytochrome B subunit, mitochondrial Flags: Precursor [Serendipita indica DSM 11827]|uniref:Related to SDH3-cytochrome b560 subunit of respiratory complex II n=1 Tax=Serendipita indica (strain DSM 11827) TaxID=1109443 RepID=G4T6Z8_SERID|nr:Succinate dehydrogenase cytochrome B subunit, mitochondrial Flags: Precursor [Serendipita indica DSM 11827]CCA67055.1 related to SDH3-cytochrome b560 subunit of respiratory complex II [Serendipita indica DSM 11827]
MLAVRAVGLRPAIRASGISVMALRATSRGVKTESITTTDQRSILDKQRLNRPSSPHMTIYEPQITWYGSIAHRITGVGLSVGMYAFFLSYLAAPVAGIPFDSSAVVELVHGLPEWAKVAGKTVFAFPFAYHSLNGVRHLTWDSTKLLSNAAVTRSGYAVIAGAIISTAALVMM